MVTEPGQPDHYPFSDRVLVVPEDLRVQSQKKARALQCEFCAARSGMVDLEPLARGGGD